MAHSLQVHFPNKGHSGMKVEKFPDICPICHTAMDPQFLIAQAREDDPFSRVEIAFQCPRAACRQIFVGRYDGMPPNPFHLRSVAPITPRTSAYSDEIKALSPTFIEVSDQALAAEAAGLDQLFGMGLRKALEFLVKDFAISQAASEDEKALIKKRLLGPCIQDHVADAAVKKAATKATWLGNDETHYTRRWENQDITDLKKLVRLTVNAVENALLTAHYDKEMPEGKKA